MKRLIFSGILLSLLILLIVQVSTQQLNPAGHLSFETLFRVMGQPFKTFDRSITHVLGVNVKDEKELGVYLASYLASSQVQGMEAEKVYVNDLIKMLAKQYNPKAFEYKVFIFNGPPNAFALPGGNIGITTGLLSLIKNEAQLMGILGHEKGHIELGHCIDHMRIQAKRFPGGSFLDWYFGMLIRHTFSKFQENEADNYGFDSLVALKYDPSALGYAFKLMQTSLGHQSSSLNPVNDYFSTHPQLGIRAENWLEKAKRWKTQHPDEKYYVGIMNFAQRKTRSELDLSTEWHLDLTPNSD